MKQIVVAFVLASSTLLVAAPPPPEGQLPPGKWWRRPEVVDRLQLSKEQQDRLDAAFRQHATQLVDLKGDVEKRSIELRNELDETSPQRSEVQKLAAAVSNARARLFERELMMLLDLREVLTADQWSRVRQVVERHDDRPRRGDGGRKPNPRGNRPPGGRMPPLP